MAEFTKQLYEKGILKKSEVWKDEKKCRAIRYILEYIGWIECLDGDWCEDVAKRWGIGKEYHRYDEFVDYIGKTTIERIRAKGMVSVQNWDDMGDVG